MSVGGTWRLTGAVASVMKMQYHRAVLDKELIRVTLYWSNIHLSPHLLCVFEPEVVSRRMTLWMCSPEMWILSLTAFCENSQRGLCVQAECHINLVTFEEIPV